MAITDVLLRICNDYPTQAQQPLTDNPLAAFIRGEAVSSIREALGSIGLGLKLHGSPGQGNWAQIPWIGLFDPIVTTSAESGYYVVYLFSSDQSSVHLSLNQGATATRREFGRLANSVLIERAQLMRRRLSDYADRLAVTSIELGSIARLPSGYEAGHATGVTYKVGALPDEADLVRDLQCAVAAYRALTFRGGIGGDSEEMTSDTVANEGTSITETRRYILHRKIERNGTAAKAAKKFHGLICQACDLDFAVRYGTLGTGFIEAHHLTPISSLTEGVAVSYDVSSDFAVLCSNCHRMIHRTDDPSDLESFRKRITA